MEGEALHGDRVEVEIVRRQPRLRRVVGRVTRVTGPVHERIIGTLMRVHDGWCVRPENELLPVVTIIGERLPSPEEAGLVALVRLVSSSARAGMAGELESILGASDDPEVQFLTIAYEHGLRIEFPQEVLVEAARLPADPVVTDYAGRRDLRDLPFVTIDGETARDFDDAVSLQELEDGGYRLWVAIADVAHYVTPGSALDAEAVQRGTSVYFPDRAIPMLPSQLSTDLCSLRPERDRLVLVAELVLDHAGVRRSAECYRAVIRSRARLTYTKVAAVLSDAQTPEIRVWRAELARLLPQLRVMQTLMRILYRNRVTAGSLDLDLPEALVDLSEAGRSIGVRLLQRNDAHRLIEEFMLEANRAVAAFLEDPRVPFPYRIHEPPDVSDIDALNEFLGPFGAHCRYDGRVTPGDVQRLLDQLDGHRLERVLSRQVLRSLRQARYSTANAGHFGLAFPVYCHFTSPIRRYPDLLVHRQLGRVFDGDVTGARAEADRIETLSVLSSQREREAVEAERAMLDLKKAEFMLGHLLEPSAGTIVSVTEFGFYVELDAYPIEGLVRADALLGERYSFIAAERALKGLRSGQRFRLGDRVEVEATNVSLQRRQIDFALLRRLHEGGDSSAARRQPRAHRGKGKKPRTSTRRKRR
jgi:ribonuclease R